MICQVSILFVNCTCTLDPFPTKLLMSDISSLLDIIICIVNLLNIFKLPDLYKLELYKLYCKRENEQVPNYFTTVINPLTHHYNTSRQAIQQLKTIHAFVQHYCIFSVIDLIIKSPIIRLRVTTCHNILSFVSSLKRDILDGYEYFCSMRNCYVCNRI